MHAALATRTATRNLDGTWILDGVGFSQILAPTLPVQVSFVLYVRVECEPDEPRRLHELTVHIALDGHPICLPLRVPFIAPHPGRRSFASLVVALTVAVGSTGELTIDGTVDDVAIPAIAIDTRSRD